MASAAPAWSPPLVYATPLASESIIATVVVALKLEEHVMFAAQS